MTFPAKRLSLWSVFMVVVGLAACKPPQMSIPGEAPPNSPQAAELRRVAVLDFQESGGDTGFAAQFESLLTQATFKGQKYFTVVDRRTLDKAIDELKLTRSGLFEKAARIGKFVKADGIYSGSVTYNIETESYIMNTLECAEGPVAKGKCKQVRKSITCYKSRASATVLPRLLSAETGQVVYALARTGIAEDKACNAPPSERPILAAAANNALAKIRRDIAPFEYTLDAPIKFGTEALDEKAKAEAERAIAFARAGRFDRACEIWRDPAIENTSILYNRVLCLEAMGKIDEAYALVKTLDQSLPQPDADISAALGRLNTHVKEATWAAERSKPAIEPDKAPATESKKSAKKPQKKAKPKGQGENENLVRKDGIILRKSQ